jgi:hypothetical protein
LLVLLVRDTAFPRDATLARPNAQTAGFFLSFLQMALAGVTMCDAQTLKPMVFVTIPHLSADKRRKKTLPLRSNYYHVSSLLYVFRLLLLLPVPARASSDSQTLRRFDAPKHEHAGAQKK